MLLRDVIRCRPSVDQSQTRKNERSRDEQPAIFPEAEKARRRRPDRLDMFFEFVG